MAAGPPDKVLGKPTARQLCASHPRFLPPKAVVCGLSEEGQAGAIPLGERGFPLVEPRGTQDSNLESPVLETCAF